MGRLSVHVPRVLCFCAKPLTWRCCAPKMFPLKFEGQGTCQPERFLLAAACGWLLLQPPLQLQALPLNRHDAAGIISAGWAPISFCFAQYPTLSLQSVLVKAVQMAVSKG